jgi:hypothetical protein
MEVGLALLANASMPLKFWDVAFLTATRQLTSCLAKLLTIKLPPNFFSKRPQIILLYESLDVHVGLILGPLTLES